MQLGLTDAIGLAGVTVIVITYMLLQFEKMDSKALSFSVLNALGAFMIIISLLSEWNFSAFLIEFFWIAISLYGVGKYFKNRSG